MPEATIPIINTSNIPYIMLLPNIYALNPPINANVHKVRTIETNRAVLYDKNKNGMIGIIPTTTNEPNVAIADLIASFSFNIPCFISVSELT